MTRPDPSTSGAESRTNVAIRRLILAYALLACLWVVLSDALLAHMQAEHGLLSMVHTAKDVSFVVVSAAIAFLWSRHYGARRHRTLEPTRAGQDALEAILLALPEVAERMSEPDFLRHGLECLEQLTGSRTALVHFVHDDQETLELAARLSDTLPNGTAALSVRCPAGQAGIWADALRHRAPVMVNEDASGQDQQGLPAGGAPLHRFISVPVLENDRVRMLVGVGNKPSAYSERDVETLRLVSETLWRMVRQRRAESALRTSEVQHRLLADNVSDVIWTMNLQGQFTYVSPSVEKLRGFTVQEVMAQSIPEALCPPGAQIVMDGLAREIAKLPQGLPFAPFVGELEQPCKDGTTVWTEVRTGALRDDQGVVIGVVGVSRDISQRRAQQAQLKLAAQVLAQGREGITVTDAHGTIILTNKAFSDITGYTEAEVLGKNPRLLHSGKQDQDYYAAMWNAIRSEGYWCGEIWNRKKDGTVYPQWLEISALHDPHGAVTHYVGTFGDLTSTKAAEERIRWLSQFDALTGLPNRGSLKERATLAIHIAQRAEEPLAMLVVGIDQFAGTAEAVGHRDQLLVHVAARLQGNLRAQDLMGRSTDTEFAILLPNTSPSGAAHLATVLMSKVARPMRIEQSEVNVTVSLGIAEFPDSGNNFDTLLHAAEIAMHMAQSRGRGSYQFFSQEMSHRVAAREKMVRELRNAIADEQLFIQYQPQAEMQTGKVCGLEALLRWNHPELGLVPPTQFIPVAEETGLIVDIGAWVVRQVCRDLHQWRERQFSVGHVSINVSPLQFYDANFLHIVESALGAAQIDPAQLYIEVTEGALMDDVPQSEAMVHGLKELGVKLSLDDFGTGYSSLSYLKKFPFDQIKIDQSFVNGVTHDPSDIMLVKVIVSMAHGLGMKAIAEGVETEAQCEIMRSSGCDEIQGYFFAHPLAGADLDGFLSGAQTLPAHLLHQQKPKRTLLLVDDEPNILTALRRLFRRDGHKLLTAGSGAQALEVLSQNKVDVIITDQRMPGMTGVEMLRTAKALYPDTVRMVLSGYTELQSVTDAINEGAVYRFLTKPWDDDQLLDQVRKAFAMRDLIEENQALDARIRTTNQELVAANRHLSELLARERDRKRRGAARHPVPSDSMGEPT